MSLPAPEPIMIRRRRHPLWHPLPFGLLLAVLLSLAIDVPVATYARNPPARWLSELLETAESFGNGFGSTAIVIAVLILDPVRRRQWPVLLGGSLGSGLASNVCKLLVIRPRPRDFETFPESAWSTFGGIWSISEKGSQSFPSSHTATAVGLAVILSDFYPRGRWYFTFLAILVGLQRVQVSAHFPSDVFGGAIVGWLIGSMCLILNARQQGSLGQAGNQLQG